MNLEAIALRISSVRTARRSLLDAVRDNCSESLPNDVGGLIGRGGQGEAYALGPDRVLKIGLAKDSSAAESLMDKLDRMESDANDVVVSVFDHGVLCDVDGGVAYFYVMERLNPLDDDSARRASKILTELVDLHASSKGDLEQLRKKFLFVKTRELKQEAKLQNKAEDTDEWDETNVDGGITMGAIDLFDRMTKAGMRHVDMNSSNIMKTSGGSLKLIDVESMKFVDG